MEILYSETAIRHDIIGFNYMMCIAIAGISLILTLVYSYLKMYKEFRINIFTFLISTILVIILWNIGPFTQQHEVVLEDGYTIDKTKYKIIEQHGKIFVIQELK